MYERGGTPPSRILLAVALIILLCIIFPRGSTSDGHALVEQRKPFFAPHFPGEYGAAALTNLTRWSSNILEATLLMYKEFTQRKFIDEAVRSKAIEERRYLEPRGFMKYDLFNPYVTCPGGTKQHMGGTAQDQGKWLCASLLEPPCTIISLGSNGDFTFENDMLKATECEIFTFDCTYDGHSLGNRHKYIKKCLGSSAKAAANSNFTTLSAAMAELGVEKISVLKIDIEGYEFDTLTAWKQQDLDLPEQIAIEVHHMGAIYLGTPSWNNTDDFSNLLWPLHELSLSDLGLFFGHLAGLGYAVASREDNPGTHCCAEFLLLKVGDWQF